MKKVSSISLSVLMLIAILNVSIAIHFCGGHEVAKKVSLSGKLASCGMKCPDEEIPLTGIIFTRKCCHNIVIVCGTSSDYSPTFSFIPESYQHNLQFLPVHLDLSSQCQKIDLFYSQVSPPGTLMSTDVDLSGICVFRI